MTGKCNKNVLVALAGIVLGASAVLIGNYYYHKSSTNESCMACHYHPEADASWKKSMHYDNGSGVMTECVACHLPPEGGIDHFVAKAKTGMKDVWSYLTKDKEEIDWDSKGELEHAVKIVYNESCKSCHVNLFPSDISDDGVAAHLHYEQNEKEYDLQCISCHLNVGHFNPNYKHARMTDMPSSMGSALGGLVSTVLGNSVYTEAASITSFQNFKETIPGTSVHVDMVAIPGGTFAMGSDKGDAYSNADEYPKHNVTLSPFFMSQVEITWNQYWAFYAETMSEGRTPPETIYANNSREDVDAVSGPTPPFGTPDQGWGMGERPAITMTHYAAQTFCQWLSLKTGKKYRLPTEAEWEYAARGGTTTPYFFEGDPGDFTNDSFWNGIFGVDTTGINHFVIYANNARNRTQDPSKVAPNPFGLKNMLGNVMEYCSDWYGENAYANIQDGALNPQGPESGTEHVVRGGMYSDDAINLRSAARAHTNHDAWLRTDPQNPKSIWWYSDIKGIGFRIVCEVPEGIATN